MKRMIQLLAIVFVPLVSLGSRGGDCGVQASEIQVHPEMISTGEQAALSIQASGKKGLTLQWTASQGTLAAPSEPSTLYTAPSREGTVTLSVRVTGGKCSVVKSRLLDIKEPPDSVVTLTRPRDNAAVPCQTFAEGTYSHHRASTVWPVVYISDRYHPQGEGGKGLFQGKGKGPWRRGVVFGDCANSAKSSGLSFQLLVVTVDDVANQAFEKYLSEAAGDGYPGLPSLPLGAKEHARVVVTRK